MAPASSATYVAGIDMGTLHVTLELVPDGKRHLAIPVTLLEVGCVALNSVNECPIIDLSGIPSLAYAALCDCRSTGLAACSP